MANVKNDILAYGLANRAGSTAERHIAPPPLVRFRFALGCDESLLRRPLRRVFYYTCNSPLRVALL